MQAYRGQPAPFSWNSFCTARTQAWRLTSLAALVVAALGCSEDLPDRSKFKFHDAVVDGAVDAGTPVGDAGAIGGEFPLPDAQTQEDITADGADAAVTLADADASAETAADLPDVPVGTDTEGDGGNDAVDGQEVAPGSDADSAGTCQPGNCDDGDPCTADSCGPGGCAHSPNKEACTATDFRIGFSSVRLHGAGTASVAVGRSIVIGHAQGQGTVDVIWGIWAWLSGTGK